MSESAHASRLTLPVKTMKKGRLANPKDWLLQGDSKVVIVWGDNRGAVELDKN